MNKKKKSWSSGTSLLHLIKKFIIKICLYVHCGMSCNGAHLTTTNFTAAFSKDVPRQKTHSMNMFEQVAYMI